MDFFMFVCICNAVSDQQIADAVKAGACDLQAIQEILLVSTACGTCRPTAEAVIADTLLETAAGRRRSVNASDIANLVYAA